MGTEGDRAYFGWSSPAHHLPLQDVPAEPGRAGEHQAAAPSWELADITPGKGGSRWDIAMALPTAKLNIKHLAEGSRVLTAQEVCHGGTAK